MIAKYGLIPPPPVAGASLLDLMSTPAPLPLVLTARAEFFLEELLGAGDEGITTIGYPGVRVGDAIYKLRKAGVAVDTVYEEHGGEFAGHHGRYFLKSKVVRLASLTLQMSAGSKTEAPHV